MWRRKNIHTIILSTINLLKRRRNHYRIRLRKTVLVPVTPTSLQAILTAEAHLAEGQFLLEKQTLNKAKSLIQQAGTQRPTVFK
jgi:hypothetical protein